MDNTILEVKTKTALNSFKAGNNCAQSVLIAYADELNLNLGPTLELASGFGGGMGRLQKTCGAVTGSIMVIGIYNNQQISNDEIRSERNPLMIQDFNSQFIKRNGTTDCSTLINCDLKTEIGQNSFIENDLGKKVCQKCISDSIEILEEIKSSHV